MQQPIRAFLLAAGIGSRLKPFTDSWPKCLMPISKHPLLEYWLQILENAGIDEVLINRHHHEEIVQHFLEQQSFNIKVSSVYEPKLLGTAGSLRKNTNFFQQDTILLIHADNWCCCNFSDFISFHQTRRPENTLITMMTFDCIKPTTCGIVELDENGVVTKFHEKVKNPPGNLANAAVYLLEPEVMQWLSDNPQINDFSTEVLPHYLGKIASWKNTNIHRDIGTIEMLALAQKDDCNILEKTVQNSWQKKFIKHPIHDLIANKTK